MEEETTQVEQTTTETQEKTYSEAEYNALQEQLKAMKSQIDTANQTIQSYKDMNIDGIKASVEDYKQKWEKSESDRKAFEYKTKLGQYVKSLGLRDDVYEQHVVNLFMEKGLQFDGDKLNGADEALKDFRESHADAFQPVKPYAGHTPGLPTPSADAERTKQLRSIYGLR